MKLVFDPQALTDLHYWAAKDARTARQIFSLLHQIQTRHGGIRLGQTLCGTASARIDAEHRLVYRRFTDKVIVLSCRYHY